MNEEQIDKLAADMTKEIAKELNALGLQLAPKEPTREMIDAGVAMALQVSVSGQGGWSNYVAALYKQMLAAIRPI